jgi:type IV pilus assembly protein PilA
MIVTACVGGLAAIELPVYRDYVIRARVAEGMVLARTLKMTVAENAAAGMQLNGNTPGVGQPPFTPTESIKDLTVADNGEITITYQPQAGNGTLVLSPLVGVSALTEGVVEGRIIWSCNSASSNKTGTRGTLPSK